MINSSNGRSNAGERMAQIVLGCSVFVLCIITFVVHNGPILDVFLSHPSDPRGYYQYLPGLFVDHDITQLTYAHRMPNGAMLSVFSMGVAIMQMPFFLAAHMLCLGGLAEPDGYTWPYSVAIGVAGAVYSALGVVLTLKSMSKLFGTTIAIIATVLIFLGTNLYYYAAFEAGMSHIYSFFLFALLLRSTLGMIDQPRPLMLFLLSLAGTIIIMVRPPNGIVLLVPLLYGANNFKEVIRRLRWPLLFPKAALVSVLICGTILGLQLAYWYAVSGQLVVFTYGEIGQQFDWVHARLHGVLFHEWNGWFLYSPIMAAVIGALIVMAVKGESGARTLLTVWVFAWYIIASWWCWWLGGAFGHRGFVEYLALLVVPLAWLVERILRTALPIKVLSMAMGIAFCYFSLGLTRNYAWPWDGPNWTMDSVVNEYERLLP